MADQYTLSGSPKTVGDTSQTSFSMASSGSISAGKTGFNTGTGWWFGVHENTAKVAIGDPESERYLVWDGTYLYGGQLLLGTTARTYVTLFTTNAAGLGLASDSGTRPNSNINSARFSNDPTNCSVFSFVRGRGTTASELIVASGDEIGQIIFQGVNIPASTIVAAKINAFIDGTPGVGTDMPGRLGFWTCPDGSATVLERWRINNAGILLGGSTGSSYLTSFSGTTAGLVLSSDSGSAASSNMTTARFSTDTAASTFVFIKGRGTTAANTIVASGDTIGTILWQGIQSNGSVADCARIRVEVDGTPGASVDMPGRMSFWTSSNASSTPTERWRITSDGNLLAVTDNSWDIGAPGARPRTGYFATTVETPKLIAPTSSDLNFATQVLDTAWYINGGLDGELSPFADNVYDLGTTLLRVRTGYFGTSVESPTFTVSGLTDGRVVIVGTGGTLADDEDLTFSSETLTAHTAVISTGDLTVSAGAINGYSGGNGINIYNTFTDINNYERLTINWNTNKGLIYTNKAGTGTDRPLVLGSASSSWWELTINGNFIPETDNARDLGGVSNNIRSIYLATSLILTQPAIILFANGQNIKDSGGAGLDIRVTTNAASATINFATNNTQRWRMELDGHLIATTDNTIDIGASGATRPRTGYFGTSISTPLVHSPDSSTELVFRIGAAGDAWNIHASRHFYPAVSNASDLGLTTNMVRTGYFGTSVVVNNPTTTSTTIGAKNSRFLALLNTSTAGAGGEVVFGYADTDTNRAAAISFYAVSNTGSGGTGYIVFSTKALTTDTTLIARWYVTTAGNFEAWTDNTYDIGASGANRPRTIYATTSFSTPGQIGAALGDAPNSGNFIVGRRDTGAGAWFIYSQAGALQLYENGADRWVFTAGASSVFHPDANNVSDIGGTSNLIRTGYFGTSIRVPEITNSTLDGWEFTGSGVQLNPGGSSNISNGVTSDWAFYTGPFGGSAFHQFSIRHSASSVDHIDVTGSASGLPILGTAGTSANIGIEYGAKGSGTHRFYTDLYGSGGSLVQFEVLHTASATRNIRVTGSNGGNPTISVSAGSLAITPDTHFAADIAVNGGDLTTTQTTFNLLNATAQTLNIGGGASTVIQMGHISGNHIFAGSTIAQNSQSAAYTLVAADANKHILHPTSDNNARTFTIPANASVAYALGTAVTFVNQINTVTIAINSDTLTLAGAGTTGSRTLAANGVATAIKVASTVWYISGTGLT